MSLERTIAVARGDEPADVVVAGGRVLSVFTREWLECDVAIADGVVAGLGSYDGAETIDATGRFVVPGLIDAHMHLESVKLLVDEFARLVLPFGTTAIVADPHEIANVLGVDGVHWLLDASSGLQLDVFFMAPSCVPASPFESPRRALGPGDLESLMRRRRVLGLAEMMNFPGVVQGAASELEKLALDGAAHVDGHAPGLRGKELQAYAAAGIYSDHEALTAAEGLERLRAGMWLLIREASMARNLQALLPLVLEYGPGRIAFCTDDRDPEHIADDGHINGMVRDAVAAGVAPEVALIMASLHPAQWHGLDGLGAIAPGYQADILLLPDLERFVPELVLKRGRPLVPIEATAVPDWVRQTVRIKPVSASDLAIPASEGQVRVIGLIEDQVVTEALMRAPVLVDGLAVADADADLAKIAVVERHLATGRIGLGFVSGSRLRRGALASTVAHDAHNLVVVGMNDADMTLAVSHLAAIGGGIAAVDGGAVVAECALPVAGLLSDAPLAEVIDASRACNEAAAELGWAGATPFLTLAFLALSVIPSLKLTDQGLVDVDAFRIVPLAGAVVSDFPLGLTYDDVLLVPRRSRVRSRQDVSTRSSFTPAIPLEVPIVSANMDTVTTAPMAVAMAQLGGIGVLHRFLSIEEEAAEVRRVKRFLTHIVAEPYAVAPSLTLAQARAEAERLAVTGFLVVDDDRRLLGVLTARDLLAGADGDRVDGLMTPRDRVVTGPPGIELADARRLLTANRIEKLPLVDDEGRVGGLVTLRDLALADRYPRATRDALGRLRVAAAVGIRGDYLERAGELVAAEVDALVLDIAHGHADAALEAVSELKSSWPEVDVVAGNVATGDGVVDLAAAGADAVKVGIGPGFACTTRLVAGVGVPQLSAVLECAAAARESGIPLIADGGIRRAGHVATAMAAGASTVMVGSLFAGRDESPGDVVRRRGQLFKVYRGMASRSAAAARLAIEGRGDSLDQYVAEGEEMEFPLRGPVAAIVEELHGGLRSGMSYVDAEAIPEFWEKARFVRQTEAGERESRPGTA